MALVWLVLLHRYRHSVTESIAAVAVAATDQHQLSISHRQQQPITVTINLPITLRAQFISNFQICCITDRYQISTVQDTTNRSTDQTCNHPRPSTTPATVRHHHRNIAHIPVPTIPHNCTGCIGIYLFIYFAVAAGCVAAAGYGIAAAGLLLLLLLDYYGALRDYCCAAAFALLGGYCYLAGIADP